MRNYSIDILSEQIKNSKSKEYFEEVVKSFYSNNNRSAIVMLYSVVICDLIFKLQELKEQYNDDNAKSILNEIEEIQKRNPTSSQWENQLIELVKEKTNILENSDYQNIVHLQKHRHLCAHPVILQNYELYSPNQETVRAHIINISEGLLIKPSLLSKKVFDEFLANLVDIKDILIKESDIETHLSAKYFDNLNSSVEKELFRSLWKIVFKIDNTKCNENRDINFKALKIILNRNYNLILDFIKADSQYFSNNLNFDFFDIILKMINSYPKILENLNKSAKTLVSNKINQDNNYVFIAWFLNDTLVKHLTFIKEKDYEFFSEIKTKSINELFNVFKQQGLNKEGNELIIFMYGKSTSFDQADAIFDNIIQQNIKQFSLLELTELVKNIQNNGQVNGRRYAKWSNRIIKEKIDILNPSFYYSPYNYFET